MTASIQRSKTKLMEVYGEPGRIASYSLSIMN
jgi:hypothetical protein